MALKPLEDLVQKLKVSPTGRFLQRAKLRAEKKSFADYVPVSSLSIGKAVSNARTLSDYFKGKSDQPNRPGVLDDVGRMAAGTTSKLLKVSQYPLRLSQRGSEDIEQGVKTRDPLRVAAGTGQFLAGGGAMYYGGKAMLKGGLKGIAGRTVQGGILGTGIGTGAQLITGGGIPTRDQAKEYFQNGVENSWTLAITNAVTDKVLASIAPHLVGRALTEPFKHGEVRQGFKQVLTRALAEVPAENTAFVWLDRLDEKSQKSFIEDWLLALPGNTVTNLAFGFGQGVFHTAKNKESRKVIQTALEDTIKGWSAEVELVGGGTMPKWKYEATKNQIGLSTKDIGEMSVEDYAKTMGISMEEAQKEIAKRPKVGQKERGHITTLKESEYTPEEFKKNLSDNYTPISNAKSLERAEVILQAEGWEAAKEKVLSGEFTDETIALAELMEAKAIDMGKIDDFDQIAVARARQKTRMGQHIQAGTIYNRLTPVGMVKYAENKINDARVKTNAVDRFVQKQLGIKNPELSKQDKLDIAELMKKSNATTDPKLKNQYVNEAMEIVNDRLPYTFSEFIDALRYNGLLSNPLTQMKNFTTNALQTLVMRPATKSVDALISGDLDQATRGTLDYYTGLIKGWDEAIQSGKDSYSGKVSIENPDIRDLRTKKLPGFFTVPTRLMEASDKFWQSLIASGEIKSGMTEAEAKKLAKYSLFRQDLDVTGEKTGQGDVLKWIDKRTGDFLRLSNSFRAMRWFVPFVKTPMNVSKQMIEYSPAGILTVKGAQNQSEQLAKTMIGSVVMAIGAKLAFEGKTTWAPPSDPVAKQLFYAEGKKPFAVKVGDDWVPMMTYGVAAYPLALSAAAKFFQEDSRTALTDSQMQKLEKTITAQARYFADQTYFEGIKTLSDAVAGKLTGEENPEQTLLGSFAFTGTQLIPFSGLLAYVSRIIDPVYRKTDSTESLGTVAQTVQRRLPFVSRGLEPYTNPRGEESVRNETRFGVGGPLGLAPYETGTENPEYAAASAGRQSKIQENSAMRKFVSRAETLDQNVRRLFELGETERAAQLIQENKEDFIKYQAYKEIRADIRKFQGIREQLGYDQRLTKEQKVKLNASVEKEIEARLELLQKVSELETEKPTKVKREDLRVDLGGIGDELAKANPFNPPEAKAAELEQVSDKLSVGGTTVGEEIGGSKLVADIRSLWGRIKGAVGDIFDGDEEEEKSEVPSVLAMEAPEEPTATPFPTATEEQLRVDLPANYVDNESKQIVVQSGDKDQEITRINVPEKISEVITDVFGRELALEAAQVLHHPYGKQVKDEGRGENPDFKISNITISNEGYDEALDSQEYVNDTLGKDGKWHSWDRGLFRINNRTLQTFLFGKEERKMMLDAGIIDRDYMDDGEITKEEVQKTWDAMEDLEKNVAMAKIIYERQGWGAWFAAPIALIK